MGLWEARLLYFVPSVKEFLVVDSTWVVWFLAPLVAMLLFATIGAKLGFFATLGKSPGTVRGVILACVLVGCAGAYVGWAGHFVHTHSVNFNVYGRMKDVLFPLVRLAMVFAAALVVAFLARKRIEPWFRRWKALAAPGAGRIICNRDARAGRRALSITLCLPAGAAQGPPPAKLNPGRGPTSC